jgi:hypothetical protein
MRLTLAGRRSNPTEQEAASPEPELSAELERLTERFALIQSELGGLFYEMAIRDHLNIELLVERAAAMQFVETELAHVQHLKRGGDTVIGGSCGRCAAPYARGAGYCSRCGEPVAET